MISKFCHLLDQPLPCLSLSALSYHDTTVHASPDKRNNLLISYRIKNSLLLQKIFNAWQLLGYNEALLLERYQLLNISLQLLPPFKCLRKNCCSTKFDILCSRLFFINILGPFTSREIPFITSSGSITLPKDLLIFLP